jgi:hypothetical protein
VALASWPTLSSRRRSKRRQAPKPMYALPRRSQARRLHLKTGSETFKLGYLISIHPASHSATPDLGPRQKEARTLDYRSYILSTSTWKAPPFTVMIYMRSPSLIRCFSAFSMWTVFFASPTAALSYVPATLSFPECRVGTDDQEFIFPRSVE